MSRDLVGLRVLHFAQPIRQQPERVIPQGIDLDRLAAAWGHHPIAGFGIHPGQRVTFLPLGDEPVTRVDLDAEAGAFEVMPYDVREDWQKELQGRLVPAMLDIAVQRVKEPQRRIGGVIEALVLSFRKQVRNESVAYVVSKGPQDPARLDRSPGCQSDSRERDHRVPTPVGEPVVTRDHRADLISLGARPRPISNAPHRGDDKGVGGEDEFSCEPDLCRRRHHPNETPPPLALEGQRVVGAQCQHGVPSLRRRDQCQRAILADLSGKIARTP